MKGSTMRNPSGTIIVPRDVDMTVDDATLNHTDEFNTSLEKLMTQINSKVSTWGQYLGDTGGLLEFTKAKYNMLIWNFEPNRRIYIEKGETLPDNKVFVKDSTGKRTEIQRVEGNTALRMLGAQKAGTLDEKDETKAMTIKKSLLSL
eukprot:15339551-Ditylum_brightwellii.AAC.1